MLMLDNLYLAQEIHILHAWKYIVTPSIMLKSAVAQPPGLLFPTVEEHLGLHRNLIRVTSQPTSTQELTNHTHP